MAKYQIDSIQNWPDFFYDNVMYSLSHLDAHEITLQGHHQDYCFVVTYGLHCFAKEGTPYNITLTYGDGREKIAICLERYQASKQIRSIMENLANVKLYHTAAEKFFTLNMMNSTTGQVEPYKICIAFYKEKRLLRMHVLSAFFVRKGPGSPGVPVPNKAVSIFKIAMDTARRSKHAAMPKEAKNRHR